MRCHEELWDVMKSHEESETWCCDDAKLGEAGAGSDKVLYLSPQTEMLRVKLFSPHKYVSITSFVKLCLLHFCCDHRQLVWQLWQHVWQLTFVLWPPRKLFIIPLSPSSSETLVILFVVFCKKGRTPNNSVNFWQRQSSCCFVKLERRRGMRTDRAGQEPGTWARLLIYRIYKTHDTQRLWWMENK